MAMNRTFIGRILTSLVSLESWDRQISNDAGLVSTGAMQVRFMVMSWFDLIQNSLSVRFIIRNIEQLNNNMTKNEANIYPFEIEVESLKN